MTEASTKAITDASFADGDARALRLRALDAEDLAVLSALVQDAVVQVRDLGFLKKQRRFAALVNRFRWEGATRTPERVRAVLVVEGALAAQAQGVAQDDPDLVLSILSIAFEPGEDGAGRVVLTLAGDGAVAVEVEALEVTLTDVTRPYLAPSRKAPSHPD